MKNLVLTFVLTLLTLSMYGQTTVDSTQISNAERIIDKYSGKIADAFNTGVEKVGAVAEEGFYLAVKLQFAEGIVKTLPLLLALLFWYFTAKEYKRIEEILASDNVPRHMDNSYGPVEGAGDNITAKLIICFIIAVVMSITAGVHSYDGITHLIAPEWYAIKDIISLFK